jgi:hypothetical protein
MVGGVSDDGASTPLTVIEDDGASTPPTVIDGVLAGAEEEGREGNLGTCPNDCLCDIKSN